MDSEIQPAFRPCRRRSRNCCPSICGNTSARRPSSHEHGDGLCWPGLLSVSLWLGPWNVLRRRPNPTSFDLRRDVGIWAGILAIVHTAIGLTVHLRGRMWMYFFKGLHPFRLQNTQFGFANFTGLGASLLFLMLLAISNDLSLRTLKARRWKSLQRWTYVAFVLTGAHGIGYQLIEKRHVSWVLIFAAIMTVIAAAQFLAFVQVHWRLRAQTLSTAPRISEERSPQP